MSLLERYIFRKALVSSLATLASLAVIVWIVQALQRVDIVRTSASAAGNIFWIALMLLPDLAAGVLPFAVLIGSIAALNALNADSERAVIAASGAPSRVVFLPVILLGFAGALVILFNSHVLGPAAQSAFHNGVRTINADAITLFLRPGRFEEVQDGLVISLGEVNGSVVKGLFLSDQRDRAADLTYFAKQARIFDREGQSYLLLYDGQLHRKTLNDGSVSVIQFQTYAFDLASLKPVDDGDWIRTAERSTYVLLNPDPNDPSYQSKPTSFTSELTQRFSDWLYPIAFALWALVVAGQPLTNRQGPGPAMLIGLFGALGLKALGFASLSLVARDPRAQFVVYLIPLMSIGLSTFMLRKNIAVAHLSILDRWSDRVRAFVSGVLASLPGQAPLSGKAGRR